MPTETITLNIDGKDVSAQKGMSILAAALDAGIFIPHLCYHPDLPSIDNCKLCVIEIEGKQGLVTACTAPAENGMAIKTATDAIKKSRNQAFAEILSRHPSECGTCVKYLNCQLQSLKQYFSSEELDIKYRPKLLPVDDSNPLFTFDPNKCVLCGRCIRACRDLRGIGILDYREKEGEKYIGTADNLPLADSGCRFCGACAGVCPTGAILDRNTLSVGKSQKAALVPCRYTCPAEIDVPSYVRFIKEKNYSAAVAVIREKAPFPEVLGYICNRPCEGSCRRGDVNQPVSIRDLKRFAAAHDSEGSWKTNLVRDPLTGKKVAVIGSGPAGLTAAYYLAVKGHSVVVYETLPEAGGMLRYGIPEYRLPRQVIDKELDIIKSLGVTIETGKCIESIDHLFKDGNDAVLVAIGAQSGLKLRIPGSDHKDVLIGVTFLRSVNQGTDVKLGNKVLVLGGGNVAFDCARVARRLGAGVTIACLEARNSMLASDDEIIQAEEEGISIYPSRSFTRILTKDGRITGVECLEVTSLSFDEDNNLQIETREGSQNILDADTVIFAIGQKPEIPNGFGLEVTSNNLICLDPFTSGTDKEGVFAAGDAVSGTSSAIKAIASGRTAAAAIDSYLGGNGIIDKKLAPQYTLNPYLGRMDGFAGLPRCSESCILPEERTKGFCPVALNMDEDKASSESLRCLQCDLRLKITPVKFWSNY